MIGLDGAAEADIFKPRPRRIPQAGRGLRAGDAGLVCGGDAPQDTEALIGQCLNGIFKARELLQMAVAVPIFKVLRAAQQGKRSGRDGVDDHDDLGGRDLEKRRGFRGIFGCLNQRLESNGKGGDTTQAARQIRGDRSQIGKEQMARRVGSAMNVSENAAKDQSTYAAQFL